MIKLLWHGFRSLGQHAPDKLLVEFPACNLGFVGEKDYLDVCGQ